ncbi:MAG: STAS-like domain-containing protein [Curvibacter sp.]|nr:STAS-like domain-containing protein [Curvibacter sp.]
MVKIRILDHVSTASSYEDGETVYTLIKSHIDDGNSVDLSFDGISSVPSAFVNSAIIRLLENFSFEQVKAHLHIIDSTRHINQLIKSRFDFATKNTSGKAT